MNAVVVPISPIELNNVDMRPRPAQLEAEAAFRTVLEWIGEDVDRDGLRETPARLVRAFQEYFSGYGQDPEQNLW
jgi:GTP cyclohydrolase IA